tara:strand:- start:47 stop:409 length:363 start_codon:yes stop_codon:yes gene_type:complete
MKKILFVLLLFPIISFGQTVIPKLNKNYITSGNGYSACKDEYTLKKIIQLSVKASSGNNAENNAAADKFMKYHNDVDCFVLKGGENFEVIKITFGGELVELKSKDRKASIWTVKEALKEN